MEADILAILNSSKPDTDKLQSLLEEYFLTDTDYDSDNRVSSERNDSDCSEFNMLQNDLDIAFGDSCFSETSTGWLLMNWKRLTRSREY